MDQVIDLLDIAAKKYPIKALCDEIDKAESTLRNELTQQDGYKLGLKTSILIMKRTRDLKALDRIEALFNRVAFELPAPDPRNICNIMDIIADLTREFSEHMKEVSEALKDGEITKQEAFKCLRELRDLIEVCIKLQAYFESILKES